MSDSVMQAVTGRELGSRASKRLRFQGLVPATLYGKGQETKIAALNARELGNLVSHRQVVGAILEVELEGHKLTTVVKEIQRHPVKRNLLHVDLQILDAKEAVTVTVQLIAGEGVELLVDNVEVSGPAARIPVSIPVGSDMFTDGVVLASAIRLPKGLEIATDLDSIIAREAGAGEDE